MQVDPIDRLDPLIANSFNHRSDYPQKLNLPRRVGLIKLQFPEGVHSDRTAYRLVIDS
jgi:hypothetical protein